MTVPIRSEDGKVIGEVVGDTFRKSVVGSKHFLQNPPAIACDVYSLQEAQKVGAYWLVVRDAESGKTYTVSIGKLLLYGFKVERGFGSQKALLMKEWITGGMATEQPALL